MVFIFLVLIIVNYIVFKLSHSTVTLCNDYKTEDFRKLFNMEVDKPYEAY